MKKTIISICTAIALGTAVSCTDNFEDINIRSEYGKYLSGIGI